MFFLPCEYYLLLLSKLYQEKKKQIEIRENVYFWKIVIKREKIN